MTTINEPGKDQANDRAPARQRGEKRKAEPDAAIDIREALEAPIRVKKNDASVPMDPYEAMMRQHVRKSLVGKSLSSIRIVLTEAEKHKLIKTPPPPLRHGVFVVPKDLPEEVHRQIFDDQGYATERGVSIVRIACVLLKHISFERLLRCFNGRG